MKKTLVPLALAGMLAFAAPARAGDPATDAMQAAYAPYRAALFQTNMKKQAESEQAIEQARAAWRGVVARFAPTPPPPYSRDSGFSATLVRVSDILGKAAGEAREGRLAEAHETLEAVREQLAELRRRNDVVIYSDHVDAYHAEMEHLLRDATALLGRPDGLLRIMAAAGTLEYLARRLRVEAPPALAESPEFKALLEAVEASVAGLRDAVLRGDAEAVREALGRLKPPYARLFLKFG